MSSQANYEKLLISLSSLENYYNHIFRFIKPYLGNRILEIGCGVGTHTQHFSDKELIVGVDIEPRYIKIFNKKFSSFGNIKGFNLDIMENNAVGRLKKYNFDTIYCSSVLEHIKEDGTAIKKMHALLKNQGRLIIVVPAFNFLYNSLDKHLLHYKRYNKQEIYTLLKNANFKVEKQSYHNISGLIGWFMTGLLKMKDIPMSLLKLYDIQFKIDSFLENRIKLPIGLILITIARKQK